MPEPVPTTEEIAAMVGHARGHANRPDHKLWCSICVRNVQTLAEAALDARLDVEGLERELAFERAELVATKARLDTLQNDGLLASVLRKAIAADDHAVTWMNLPDAETKGDDIFLDAGWFPITPDEAEALLAAVAPKGAHDA